MRNQVRTPSSIAKTINIWLKEKISHANSYGGVVGLSGGIDSAVVAVLLKEAFGDNMLAVMMPCHSLDQDLQDAINLADSFNLPYKIIDLTPTYDVFMKNFENRGAEFDQMAKTNIKPRLRMTTLYFLAQNMNFLVCGTSNKAELTVGYFTKHGDSGSDILPLGDLNKSEVRELAEYLGIPEGIVSKPPSAGLWPGQTDENEMGLTYHEIDSYLRSDPIPDSALLKIRERFDKSAHKRQMPPVCSID